MLKWQQFIWSQLTTVVTLSRHEWKEYFLLVSYIRWTCCLQSWPYRDSRFGSQHGNNVWRSFSTYHGLKLYTPTATHGPKQKCTYLLCVFILAYTSTLCILLRKYVTFLSIRFLWIGMRYISSWLYVAAIVSFTLWDICSAGGPWLKGKSIAYCNIWNMYVQYGVYKYLQCVLDTGNGHTET